MTRLVLLTATALLVAAPAFAQQRYQLQQPPSRFATPPRAGIATNPGALRPQIAPGNGGRFISDQGGGLISNNRGGIISDHGGGFRR